MEDFSIPAMPAITVICCLLAQLVKMTKLDNKWIPSLCGLAGGMLGVLAIFVAPELAGGNPISAAATGIVSGLAATGANQVVKQLGGGTNGNEDKGV